MAAVQNRPTTAMTHSMTPKTGAASSVSPTNSSRLTIPAIRTDQIDLRGIANSVSDDGRRGIGGALGCGWLFGSMRASHLDEFRFHQLGNHPCRMSFNQQTPHRFTAA